MLFRTLAVPAAVAAASIIPPRATCENPTVRKEWRSLSADERDSYISAVHCLAKQPSKLGLSTTQYDDFPFVHNALNNDIHFVASFLPWHRYYVHIYEQALKECGYTGAAAYWDWTLDSDDTPKSSIWDPVTGVGGNGDPNTPVTIDGYTYKCVSDGPFKDLRPAYLTDTYVPHCLRRNFNNGSDSIGDMFSPRYTPDAVAKIHALPDYDSFRINLENGPHGAIHSAVAGDLMPATSPNDPLFFLHHTQIDRLWSLWQQVDPETRVNDFSGFRTQNKTGQPTPAQATLDDIMPMRNLAKDIPIRDIMSTQSDLLCYTY
ncbi:Di-copper centre-containing protein [Daldinia decipiens]|uniref:Di-copper centre-containing protein n=1 Tax=Daldinia decipiens TaxID=326647 RepID=UPI0020C2162A|nr:Di-copper centre-containing protein [Daldinia decipiens]KAI1662918.1 Di-copper centre-containing protein [Daldinia decipiens]